MAQYGGGITFAISKSNNVTALSNKNLALIVGSSIFIGCMLLQAIDCLYRKFGKGQDLEDSIRESLADIGCLYGVGTALAAPVSGLLQVATAAAIDKCCGTKILQ